MNPFKQLPELKKHYHGYSDGNHNNRSFGHRCPEERCELLSSFHFSRFKMFTNICIFYLNYSMVESMVIR